MSILELLKLEWLKYRKNKVILISLSLYFIFLPLIMLIVRSVEINAPGLGTTADLFNFPDIYEYTAYTGNWITFLIFGFIGIYIFTNEISNKTLRQSIINGMTRTQFFIGKILHIIVIALVATLYYWIIVLLLSLLGSQGFEGQIMGEHLPVLRFFTMSLLYLSLGLFFGILFRSLGVGIILYYMYIFFIELFIRWGVHLQVYEDRSFIFYPQNAAEDICSLPLDLIKGSQQGLSFDFDLYLSQTEALITCAVYVVVFWLVSFLIMRKRNI